MVDINLTQISDFTPQQVIQYCKTLSAKPSLIIFFLLSNLILVLVAVAFKAHGEKFFKIWAYSFILSLFVLVGILLLPNFIISIANFFN